MSIFSIKSVVFAFLLMSVQTVMANEINLLTVKEFQQKINADKFSQEDLSKYEINNEELIIIYKIKSAKKKS